MSDGLRKEVEFSLKDGIDAKDVVSALEEQGFDVEFHRQYHDRISVAEVRSYSVRR